MKDVKLRKGYMQGLWVKNKTKQPQNNSSGESKEYLYSVSIRTDAFIRLFSLSVAGTTKIKRE